MDLQTKLLTLFSPTPPLNSRPRQTQCLLGRGRDSRSTKGPLGLVENIMGGDVESWMIVSPPPLLCQQLVGKRGSKSVCVCAQVCVYACVVLLSVIVRSCFYVGGGTHS